ncbi:MAG: hypothetical protein HOP31_08870 [Ignavibacteria bacterium]|nr:hypothetical protein [Ignavibacteria bacterium]
MKLPVNISNETLVAELIKNNLVKPEDIVRDGNKMVKPTREEAKAMLEALPDTPVAGTGDNKPVYKIHYKDTEIGQVTDDSLHNEDDGMEIEGLKCTVHDTDKFIKAHSSKEEFKLIIEALNKLLVPETNTQEPWKQENQALPNRYYVIPKRVNEITHDGNKHYEELPSYYVNGKWCEDAAGTVECSYYDDLRPEVVKEYRAKGIIR